jgi:hypothetical protein
MLDSVALVVSSIQLQNEQALITLDHVQKVLKILFSKFSGSFRPAIEDFANFLVKMISSKSKWKPSENIALIQHYLQILGEILARYGYLQNHQLNQKRASLFCNIAKIKSDIPLGNQTVATPARNL